MGSDLYESSTLAREVFDLAEEISGAGLKTACFEGPDEALKQTIVTQPAVFAHSVASFLIVKEMGIAPEFVAGHSVGELAALVASGVLSIEDGLRLVSVRASAMHEAGQQRRGTMAAILGLDPDAVSLSCEAGRKAGVVVPANYNCPGQIVISGDVEAVQKAMQAAREIGAKRAIELQVSGAFHSELMKPAQAALADAIEDIVFSAPDVPVVPNVTAEPCLDPVELKSLLIDQIISPVKWSDSMTKLAGMGMQRAFEVGPGNTLKTLMRRIDKTINVSSAGTLADLEDLSI